MTALTRKRDYSIRSKGVYFDMAADMTTTKDRKNEKTIYFPSKAEYECFLILRKTFKAPQYELICHKQELLNGFKWNIDFRVNAQNTQSMILLAKLCNHINHSGFGYVESILIEYKGFADSNFIYKMSKFDKGLPMRRKQMLILSNACGLFQVNEKKIQIITPQQLTMIHSMI